MGSLQALKAAMNNANPKMSYNKDDIRQSVYDQIEKTQTAAPVKQEIASQPAETANANIDSLLAYYINVTGSFARLNGEILTDNLLVVLEGLPADDRIVSLSSIMFVAKNFGQMTAALILNYSNIRDVFVKAIAREMDLAKLPESERKAAHMQTGMGFADDDHKIELGITRFTTDMELIIADKMSESISLIGDTGLASEVDHALAAYTQHDADDIGAILSNPVYLLIAFNNNEAFVQDILHICESMMESYA